MLSPALRLAIVPSLACPLLSRAMIPGSSAILAFRRHPTHGSLHGPSSPVGNMSPQQLLSDPTAEVHLQVLNATCLLSLVRPTLLSVLSVRWSQGMLLYFGQVARIRGSEADHRKFYVEAGNNTLRIKAETM